MRCQDVCVVEAESLGSVRILTILEQMKSGVGRNSPADGVGSGGYVGEEKLPGASRPSNPTPDSHPTSLPRCYMFSQLLEGSPLNRETLSVSVFLATKPGDVCPPEGLPAALSCSWYLLQSLRGVSSVKERVQVLFHVDIRHQLIRRLLSTIS